MTDLSQTLTPIKESNMLTQDQRISKELLLKVICNVDTTEQDYDKAQKDLRQLIKLEKQHLAEAKANKLVIYKGIIDLEISFDELMKAKLSGNLIYTKDIVKQYVIKAGWLSNADSTDTGAADKVKPKQKRARKASDADKGFVIFTLENTSGKGISTTIWVESKFPFIVGRSYINLYEQGGDLKENLLKLQSTAPEVKEFLATPEGEAFVVRWVNWINKEVTKAIDKAKKESTVEG